MKNLILSIFTLLVATIFLAVMPTEAEGAVYEDTVRLHIRANSDSQEDQELKLKVRNAILEKYSEKLSSFENKIDAESSIIQNLGEIEAYAQNIVREYGYSYPVKASVSEEWFDTRKYESFTLPKGYYTSLIIYIGEGEGKNWWCVMYPPLCLDVATEETSYTDAENSLIKGEYVVKFKILELISGLAK